LPTSLSAKKAVRQNKKHKLRNHAAKAAVRGEIRKLQEIMAAGDAAKAAAEYKTVARMLDKTVQRGMLKKNTASRYKSRLALKLAAIAVK